MPLRRLHALLTVQSVVVVLLSINRLSELTTGYVHPNEFLRWVDLHNMLTLPLLSLVPLYLLKRLLERGDESEARAADASPRDASIPLGLTLVVGAYLLGAGYGSHEVTNYLNARFCLDGPPTRLCEIVAFNDDAFSHWVFFVGFALVNAALLLVQARHPWPALRGRDLALVVANGLVIALGVFANLAFEAIGLDLWIVAGLAALAVALFVRRGAEPMFAYYATAYGASLVATALWKAVVG